MPPTPGHPLRLEIEKVLPTRKVCMALLSRRFRFFVAGLLMAAFSQVGCGNHPSTPTTTETFTTTTSQQGSQLILENRTSTDTIRIALDTAWGGSIVEVSFDGVNYVNQHDTGREVQPAFYDGNAQYDGCAGCTGTFGWDPVLGGDKYNHGTPVLSQTLTPSSLSTQAQPLQWNPDDKGGGASQPVPADVLLEQTITPVPGYARAFRAHYKLTHLGTDLHANAPQEFPAVYVGSDYDQFVSYGGTAPWTKASVTSTQFPALGTQSPNLYVPEHWGAYVNDQNLGLTIYVPSQFPYVHGFAAAGMNGPTGDGTNYFAPFVALTIGPEFTFEGDYYLIAGDYQSARQIVYALHAQVASADIFPPFGVTDAPTSGSQISGQTTIRGWAFDDSSVAKVEILVDGNSDGVATYGTSRPDIPTVYPNASANAGFSYSLDTTRYSNGPHVVNVRATDSVGNVAVLPNVAVTIAN
jgi:hypothetical protein